MRRERFAARSGYFFLVLTGVAALPMTSNAADEPNQRNVHAHMHHTGLVHRRVQARPIALVATPAAVHMAAQLSDEQRTIIVTSPEPGAVVISTKPAPNTGEPAKPEPEADNPAKPQAHGPRGWIIQIGAFELETEARQHLSDVSAERRRACRLGGWCFRQCELSDEVAQAYWEVLPVIR